MFRVLRHRPSPAMLVALALSASLLLTAGLAASAQAADPIDLGPAGSISSSSRAAIAIDTAGTAYIAWDDRAVSPNVTRFCTLARGATACSNVATFGKPDGASSDIFGPVHVFLASPERVIVVTPRLTEVYARVSTDGGRTFGADQLLAARLTASDHLPVEPDQAIYGPGDSITWINEVVTEGTAVQNAPLGSTTGQRAVLDSYNFDAALALDAGTPVAAWTRPGNSGTPASLQLSRYTGSGSLNDGSSWTPSTPIDPSVPESGADVAMAGGPAGAFVMYRDIVSGYTTVMRVGRVQGTALGPTAEVSLVGGPIPQDLFEDGSGRLHALWLNGPRDLMWRTSTDGLTWNPMVKLMSAGEVLGFVHYPRLAAAPDGQGFVVFTGHSRAWALPLVQISPALSTLTILPRVFATGGRIVNGRCVAATRANRSHRRCTRPIDMRVSYTLTIPASVTFKITRQATGRTVNGRCVAPTRANRKQRPCTREIAVRGTLTRTGKAGANSFTFHGRIGGRRLPPGSYRLTATPTADGRTGNAKHVDFQIAR